MAAPLTTSNGSLVVTHHSSRSRSPPAVTVQLGHSPPRTPPPRRQRARQGRARDRRATHWVRAGRPASIPPVPSLLELLVLRHALTLHRCTSGDRMPGFHPIAVAAENRVAIRARSGPSRPSIACRPPERRPARQRHRRGVDLAVHDETRGGWGRQARTGDSGTSRRSGPLHAPQHARA